MAEVLNLDTFARSLSVTSEAIKREVGALIGPAAQTMADRLIHRYPMGRTSHPDRPHMREDVRIGTLQGQDALLPVRRVFGPRLATIWQDGTRQRHDSTRANANRGSMPAGDRGFFQRTAVQVRSEMLMAAQAVLDRPRQID